MESIINRLTQQEAWEQFLAYRLRKGRFTWHEFEEADDYVAFQRYLPLAQQIASGEWMEIPQKKIVNKMGTDKKRVVYSYSDETMIMLKFIAFLLYRYDDCFAPNCYAFRRGLKASDAIFNLNAALQGKMMWAYKLDIHNYFNSISVPILMPILSEVLHDDPQLFQFFEKMLTNQKVKIGNVVVEEQHGVMAGTPTSPFLADVFLKEIDHYFFEKGIIYARYSDDIILFAPDLETLNLYKTTLLHFLDMYHLEVNPSKEKIYSPDEAYEYLGFKCFGREIDLSESTKQKMKGKIRRQTRSLMRWRKRKGVGAEKVMKVMIDYYNRKFYESEDPETLTWSRWFFPIITRTDGLKEIDHYLQQNIRFLSVGKHNKSIFRVDYDMLKAMGYRSLVNEYYKGRNSANH